MKVIFAGKFENALVRSVDEIQMPRQNASTHPYYAGLNRKVSKNYADRCGTFIAIAQETLVPQIDWKRPAADLKLGIGATKAGGREWDNDTRKFVSLILGRRVLSSNSYAYISNLSLSHYPKAERAHITANLARYSSAVADHYLNRLFLQLKAAREANAFVILSEEDIQILQEIGKYLVSTKLPTPFEIPDLHGSLIEPETFCAGLLNFAPPDIQSVAAVRSDKAIREYGSKIGALLADAPSTAREARILKAMVEAREKSAAGTQAETVFEVLSWIVKPLHYLPIAGNVLSAAEDIKDVIAKWTEREISKQEWFVLGPRMADIAINDYLARKGNLIRSSTE